MPTTEFGQPAACRMGFEKRAAEAPFEFAHPPMHRRLAYAQKLGGSEHAAAACDGQEVIEIVPIEGGGRLAHFCDLVSQFLLYPHPLRHAQILPSRAPSPRLRARLDWTVFADMEPRRAISGNRGDGAIPTRSVQAGLRQGGKMKSFIGGCSCGSVRFELEGHPLWVLACHCDACKKRTGSAYGVAVMVETQAVKEFSGPTRTFTRLGDSENKVHYEFCPNCGTTLRWHVDIVPGRQAFAGGTIDDMRLLELTAEMYTDAALPWSRIGCELARPRSPDDAFRLLMVSKTKSAYAGR